MDERLTDEEIAWTLSRLDDGSGQLSVVRAAQAIRQFWHDLDSMTAERDALLLAIEDIASQPLVDEIDKDEYPDPAYEDGYNHCVTVARAARKARK